MKALRMVRLVCGCAILASCMLGMAGIKDTDRRKLPLVAIATILGWAGLSRMEIQ